MNHHKILFLSLFLLGGNAYAQLQLISGSEGLYVKSGTTIIIGGLCLQPTVDLNVVNNEITVSPVPVAATSPGSNGSIARVYNVASPLTYEGMASIYYLNSELNSNTATSLELVYKNDVSNGFINNNLNTTTANATYVEGQTTGNPITITRITAVDAGVVLPIDLMAFTVTKDQGRSRLTWATANEQNNDRFEIEHASDGKTFVYLFAEKSKGGSTLPQEYLAFDEHPLTGWNFYRLKQVDVDGRFSYSPIEKVFFENTCSKIRLYPNPVHDQVTLAVTATKESKTVLTITDITGKTIHRESIQLLPGDNVFRISMDGRVAGAYTLSLSSGFTGKIVKQ